MAPQNHAAYLVSSKARPLVMREAPYTTPGANEIVIATRAISVNPIDRIKQEAGDFVFPWTKYPLVLGYDVAGEVVEVGANVSRFQPGQRALGLALGLNKDFNRQAEGAFQEYVVLQDHMAVPLPTSIDYERAVVLPLALSTAACGLFQADQLGLQYPTVPARPPTGKTLLVWGAGTSVGLNAVQLAAAAGYAVYATCSARKFDLVRSLGAEQVWDYNSPSVVADIVAAFSDRQTAGAVSVGAGSAERCMDILARCKGDKVLSMASFPVPDKFSVPGAIKGMAVFTATKWYKSAKGGLTVRPFIMGGSLAMDDVGPAVWRDFLGEALKAGSYSCEPQSCIVGEGLGALQKAIDTQKEIGARGEKSVVRI